MKKIILIGMCCLFLVSVAFAEVKPGTRQEAQQMVKKGRGLH